MWFCRRLAVVAVVVEAGRVMEGRKAWAHETKSKTRSARTLARRAVDVGVDIVCLGWVEPVEGEWWVGFESNVSIEKAQRFLPFSSHRHTQESSSSRSK